jgi:integrase
MRRSLTDAFLRNLMPPAAGRLEIWDSGVNGLVFRLTPTGAASWCVRARTADGKAVRPKLGTYPALGLSAARKRALIMLGAVQSGSDPVAEKRQKRAERRQAMAEPTVAQRLAAWQQARATDPARPWSASTAATVARMVRSEIEPALGSRRLVQTTRADWVALVEAKRMAGAPAMASLLYRTISSFLNHAEASGWIAAPLLPRKGAKTLAPPPPARARALSDTELQAVWLAAGQEAPKVRAFLRLLILSAAREGEVAGVRVGEVNLASGLWRLPGNRTKNRQPLTLPLCDLALAELRAVWPEEPTDPDRALLGRFPDSPLQGFAKIKRRLDERLAAFALNAGVAAPEPWRLHDLRRTARTGMTRLGVPRDHAEAALNHISGRSTLERTYDRHDFGPEVLAALRRWQAHVAELVASVTPVLRRADTRRRRETVA